MVLQEQAVKRSANFTLAFIVHAVRVVLLLASAALLCVPFGVSGQIFINNGIREYLYASQELYAVTELFSFGFGYQAVCTCALLLFVLVNVAASGAICVRCLKKRRAGWDKILPVALAAAQLIFVILFCILLAVLPIEVTSTMTGNFVYYFKPALALYLFAFFSLVSIALGVAAWLFGDITPSPKAVFVPLQAPDSAFSPPAVQVPYRAMQNLQEAEQIAEQLRIYKQLADDGVITPEEFEQKKKELLNL